MIVPHRGVAFTQAAEGDTRADAVARATVSSRLGISPQWASIDQVHGADVVVVDRPGPAGAADAIVTRRAGLPLVVFTADCMGVVVLGASGVGVAHAGWRGMDAGVVSALVETMDVEGLGPLRAWCGPAIGRCCFEVGPEVAERFPDARSVTSWNTISVDLAVAVRRQLSGLDVEFVEACTRHDSAFFSHRRNGTRARMATLGWWGSVSDEPS